MITQSIVVDASVVVASITEEPARDAARRLIATDGVRLIAPELMPFEAANAFWKRVRRREWTAMAHERAMKMLGAVQIELLPIGALVGRAAQLSVDHDHPIYDCAYVAMAQRERATIATFDRRLSRLAAAARVGLWAPV